MYQAIDVGQGSAINLLRDDGALVVRQPGPPTAQAIGSKYPELIAADSAASGLVLNTVDHKPRFVGMAHLADFPLVVAVTREKSIALKRWQDETYRVATRTIVLMLLGAAAIAALVYQLRRVELGDRALRRSEGRYALAMEGANEGHFDWDFEQGLSFLSPQ